MIAPPADLLFRTRTRLRPRASNWSRALGLVAKHMGHSVETLAGIYIGSLGGDETLANERIDAALGG